MPVSRNFRTRLAAAAAALAFAGCLTPEERDPALPDKAFVFAITTSPDYKTGAYAAYGLTSGAKLPGIAANHPDAALRYFGGSDIFILNRLGRDNLLIVDRDNLKVVLAAKLPELSNPQDIAVKDGLMYVCLLASDSILVFDQANGNRVGEIDIHAYADGDGRAEAAALAFAGGDLYAVTQNLDVQHGYKPLAGPKLLKIDVRKRAVAQAIPLPLANPQGLAYDPAAGKLYIPCVGDYLDEAGAPKLDGGIVSVDLASAGTQVVATEAELGGNVGRAEFYDGKLYFELNLAASDRVVAFNLAGKTAAPIADLEPYAGGGLAIDAEDGILCLGDRTRGLRLFDLGTLKEKDSSGIDLGLPPAALAVIRR